MSDLSARSLSVALGGDDGAAITVNGGGTEVFSVDTDGNAAFAGAVDAASLALGEVFSVDTDGNATFDGSVTAASFAAGEVFSVDDGGDATFDGSVTASSVEAGTYTLSTPIEMDADADADVTVNATFDAAEVKAALDALGVKLNEVIDALQTVGVLVPVPEPPPEPDPE